MRSTGSSTLYYSLRLFDVVSLDIFLDCYAIGMTGVCVRWGNSLSGPSCKIITGCVRVGGILSPYLFNVYMDDLSQSLNCCKTGCLSGETRALLIGQSNYGLTLNKLQHKLFHLY